MNKHRTAFSHSPARLWEINNSDRGGQALPPLLHSPILTQFAWGGILEIEGTEDVPYWSSACSAGKGKAGFGHKARSDPVLEGKMNFG